MSLFGGDCVSLARAAEGAREGARLLVEDARVSAGVAAVDGRGRVAATGRAPSVDARGPEMEGRPATGRVAVAVEATRLTVDDDALVGRGVKSTDGRADRVGVALAGVDDAARDAGVVARDAAPDGAPDGRRDEATEGVFGAVERRGCCGQRHLSLMYIPSVLAAAASQGS